MSQIARFSRPDVIWRSLRHTDRRRAGALLAALVCSGGALVTTACGSSTSSGHASADPIVLAAARSTSAPGYRMTMNMRLSASSLPGPLTATAKGAFNLRDRSGRFALVYDLGNIPQAEQVFGSDTLHAQAIIKGQAAYLRYPAAMSRTLGASKPWVKIDVAKSKPAGFSSLTNNSLYTDPSQTLQYLRAVSGAITTVGKQHIGGVQTTHYRATVDLNKLPDMVPESARSTARQTIARMTKVLGKSSFPVDVWIDGQHRVRQMKMSLQASADGQSVGLMVTVDFPQYGPQPSAVAPPADQVGTLTGGSGLSAQ